MFVVVLVSLSVVLALGPSVYVCVLCVYVWGCVCLGMDNRPGRNNTHLYMYYLTVTIIGPDG